MKVINKPYSNKCLIISITMVLFLLFTLAAITMSAKFSNRINIIGTRQLESEKMNINKTMLNLQTDSMTRDKEENEQLFQIDENSREAADKKNESEKEKKTDAVDNFYYYLFGYYIIMVMMSIYMINFMDLTKLKSKDKDELTLDILMFLYFANNGSLIVSIICFSTVYRLSGLFPFIFGVVILIIGTILYARKLKKNCYEEVFGKRTFKKLCSIPWTMILLLPTTFSCCRCEYYGGCFLKFCVFLWNATLLLLKIITLFFMILVYYLFLIIFLFIRAIVRGIHSISYKEKNEIQNDSSMNDTTPTENNDNNGMFSKKNSSTDINQQKEKQENDGNVTKTPEIGGKDIKLNNNYEKVADVKFLKRSVQVNNLYNCNYNKIEVIDVNKEHKIYTEK